MKLREAVMTIPLLVAGCAHAPGKIGKEEICPTGTRLVLDEQTESSKAEAACLQDNVDSVGALRALCRKKYAGTVDVGIDLQWRCFAPMLNSD